MKAHRPLAVSGIHNDVARKIWQEYLNRFDRWMFWKAHKFQFDAEFASYVQSKKIGIENAIACFSTVALLHKWFILTNQTLSDVQHFGLDISAAKGGNLEMLIWLQSNNYIHYDYLVDAAAKHGHLHVMKWVLSAKMSFSYTVYPGAVASGNLELVQWILSLESSKGRFVIVNLIEQAIEHKHFHIVKWIYANYKEKCYDAKVCYTAAESGNLEILKWAHDEGLPWDDYVCSLAANIGRLDILQYAHENGCSLSGSAFINAIGSAQMDIIQYLLDHNCPMHAKAYVKAIRRGDFDMVKKLYSWGCPWNEDACSAAAFNNQLEILRWLRDPLTFSQSEKVVGEVCPWDADTLIAAGCHKRIYDWVVANGYPNN